MRLFNMFRRSICFAALFIGVHTIILGGNTFASQRLQHMAERLSDVPFDTLIPGDHLEYRHLLHPLAIRVNQWNEVEHIGYHIFDTALTRLHPSPAYDFVERYLLDLDLDDETDRFIRMGIDKFLIEVGKADDVFRLKGDEAVEVSYMGFKRYRITWRRNDETILSFLFDTDYQLMSGENAIELEKRYLDLMRRLAQQPMQLPPVRLPEGIDSCHEDVYLERGDTFLSPSIRSDRYYMFDSVRGWHLVCSSLKPYWSAANLVLSPIHLGDFKVHATLDMYGFRKESFEADLAQWMVHTLNEGCQVFFGIKSRTPKAVHGTLFCPNLSGGYCHMMSVVIPIDALDDRSGTIEAKLFVYIPLHNISDSYFDLQYISNQIYAK